MSQTSTLSSSRVTKSVSDKLHVVAALPVKPAFDSQRQEVCRTLGVEHHDKLKLVGLSEEEICRR